MILAEAKKEEEFIESSRDKVKGFKTTLAQDVDETRADNKGKTVSLKTKS
jgi:hypothetical protein